MSSIFSRTSTLPQKIQETFGEDYEKNDCIFNVILFYGLQERIYFPIRTLVTC